MLAVDPGQLVDELQRVIVTGVRTVGDIAYLRESNSTKESGSIKRYGRNSPRDGGPAFLARNSHGGNDIGVKSQESADGVIEPGVAESCFVHEIGCEGPCVGRGILFVVGENLRSGEVQPLRGLVFVAPTITAHPLRPGRLVVIQPQNKRVAVERRGVELHVIVR